MNMKKIFLAIWVGLMCFLACATTSLVTDQDYFSILMRELDQAKTNIDILSFSFAIDDGSGKIDINNQAYLVAQKLADIKKSKKDAIQIRLYIEAERDTSSRNSITANFLEKAGVMVKHGSTHAKGFSIDHKKILFGSTNLTNQSMTKNNETNIWTDDSQIVKGFDQSYSNLWSEGKEGSIQLLPPMLADGAYKTSIINAIHSAKKSIEFSIYYFNDVDIENALIDAFTKRRIKIRGYVNQSKTFALDLVAKNRETAKRLRASGMTDIHFDLDNMLTHSKYIIRDQEEILLGTGNWNYSDVFNYRQLYVDLKDIQLAHELSVHLDEQIKTKSDPTK
jgi:phosphatidylserine/phosphatidylglycerophosphate/cardiolipin synthase-like enzyme